MSTIAPGYASPVSPALSATSRETCLNCDTPRMGEYCHACGQHFLAGRLTVGRLLWDFLARKLSLEGGLIRTFADLTFRPGATIRDYVRGRRQRYTNPVGYLLISAAVSTLVLPLWVDELRTALGAEDWGVGKAESEAINQVFVAMERHPTLATLFLCAFFVPMLRILFHKRVTTAESTVFAFFVFGHVMLWQGLLTPFIVAASTNVYDAVSNWNMALMLVMLVLSTAGFFGARLSTFLRMGVVVAVSITCAGIVLFLAGIFWGALASALQAGAVPQ